MIQINTIYRKIGLCLVLACVVSLNALGLSYQSTIEVTNRTGMPISIITLDKPYTRSDADDKRKLIPLRAGETKVIAPAGRIVGWFKPGMLIGFTVLMPHDDQLTFVLNDGVIKSIHGELRDIPVNNTKYNSITVTTKNPHEGKEKCGPCAQRCYGYRNKFTLDYCKCLNTCHDTGIDLNWYFDPRTRQHVRVGAGTTLLFADVLHDLDYGYGDDYDDDSVTIIRKKRTIIYN